MRTATLYNTFGQSVLEVELTDVTDHLSTYALPAGIYWLSIREAGRVVHQQVIVKH